jgi:hypothetical protein
LVHNAPPSAPEPATQAATAILNPVLAGLYGIKGSPDFKLGLFLGVTLPVGTGGGTNPDKDKAAAISPIVGMATRSAMDNAMFAVNYFTVFPGIDFAYIHGGFTAQVEATIFKLTKARGPDTIDKTNTNFTSGLHVGYFIIPMLSLGAEIRHQRWLSTPNAVGKDTTHATRDNTTFAVGPRLHFKLSDSIWFRPGVSLTLPVNDPMKKAEYKIVQLDLPLVFSARKKSVAGTRAPRNDFLQGSRHRGRFSLCCNLSVRIQGDDRRAISWPLFRLAATNQSRAVRPPQPPNATASSEFYPWTTASIASTQPRL